MTLSDKQTLVRLLNQYQDEQVYQNRIDESKITENAESNGISKYSAKFNVSVVVGTKAQYEHARLISSKLSLEISRELKSYCEL